VFSASFYWITKLSSHILVDPRAMKIEGSIWPHRAVCIAAAGLLLLLTSGEELVLTL